MTDWNDPRLASVNGPKLTRRRKICRNGHPMTEGNTMWLGDQRRCRTCVAASEARRHPGHRARIDDAD